MKRVIAAIQKWMPVLVVVGAYLWACFRIASHRVQEAPPGTITLRIGHWQLEPGVREGLNVMAAAYEKLHPNVRIVQDGIPESTYGQWVTTQLMGGTAPDLLELGLGLPYSIWLSYYQRYFIPLTSYVSQPNPYNPGTDLAGIPLRQTFLDAMSGSFVNEMQEYMKFPLSLVSVRIYYNKDLLKKLTGRTTPPTEYRDFLSVCETIKEHTGPDGQQYVAVAGSRYHEPMWESRLFDLLTYPLVGALDFNRNGEIGSDELFTAFQAGLLHFDDPALAGRFQILREVVANFQHGYTGLTRDDAVFLFAQQRAVFIPTGTWDARGLREQAAGSFEIGIVDFPYPLATDPEFGKLVAGPPYEQVDGQFNFGITRTCQHPEIAVDFLLFMASQKQNERLNQIIGWLPITVGAEADPFLKAFVPHLEGVYGMMGAINLGGETWVRWQQLSALFQVEQIDYPDFAKQFEAFYRETGWKDYQELTRNRYRSLEKNELFLAGLRAQNAGWDRYASQTAGREIWPVIEWTRLDKIMAHDPLVPTTRMNECSPAALQHIREGLR